MSKKKVLVIGGTGIAGQFITDYLLHIMIFVNYL